MSNSVFAEIPLDGLTICLSHNYRDGDLSVPAGFCITVYYERLAETTGDSKVARMQARDYARALTHHMVLPKGGKFEGEKGKEFEHWKGDLSYTCFIAAKEAKRERSWAEGNVDTMRAALGTAHKLVLDGMERPHASREDKRDKDTQLEF